MRIAGAVALFSTIIAGCGDPLGINAELTSDGCCTFSSCPPISCTDSSLILVQLGKNYGDGIFEEGIAYHIQVDADARMFVLGTFIEVTTYPLVNNRIVLDDYHGIGLEGFFSPCTCKGYGAGWYIVPQDEACATIPGNVHYGPIDWCSISIPAELMYCIREANEAIWPGNFVCYDVELP